MKTPGSEQENRASIRVSLFELPLDIGIENQDVIKRMASGNLLLSYLNPNAYTVAKKFPTYISNLRRFDLVVCDGIGIRFAVKSVFKKSTSILTPDYSGIGHDYLQVGARQEMSLCIVGAEQETVHKAATAIRTRYSGFKEVNAFGGYGNAPAQAKSFILKTNPDLVLVGMGMGRQESYLLDLVDSGWSGVGICVGGFFDKLAKPQLDYPKWSEKIGLRFLGRLTNEPRRLSRRYFIDYQPFMKMYIKHLVSRR